MPFEFFNHTADMGVRITGRTLEELFQAAAEAFTAAMCDLSEVDTKVREELSVAAAEVDLLLVDWLNELLWRFDARGLLVRSADVAVSRGAEGWGLRANLFGEPLDPCRHRIKILIKGITYHHLVVAETPEGWRGVIVFDI